jgi:hypothetical protein
MATPHVTGAVAILKERHPSWTVEQIKSALVQTGDPVHGAGGAEVAATREGGGMIDLTRADVPLLFAEPTSVSFGELTAGATASRAVTLSDAGGGAGVWNASVALQGGSSSVAVPATASVPGELDLTATAGSTAGDVTGFVVLTRGSDVRRIPFWLAVVAPKLAQEKQTALSHPGTYSGTTVGGASAVSTYRYPTGGDLAYPGPERVYRVTIRGAPANFGVAVTSGNVVPHVVLDTSEDHLAGYTALPLDLNPYRRSYGVRRRISGVVLPAAGTYDVVFDTAPGSQPGKFSFRYWVGDTTPPRLLVRSARGGIAVSATDAGSGVDPTSITATVDGHSVAASFKDGVIRVRAKPGRHVIMVQAADYQETKNMEDVPPILPNTATLRATVTVRAAG